MKQLPLVFLIAIYALNANAQQRGGIVKGHPGYKNKRHKSCPVFYITTGTGINNNTGLLGVNFDKPVAKSVSVAGGLGISSWGYKFFVGGSYYLKPCHRGWAFGGGLTYNTGIHDYQQNNVETVYGTKETVQLELHPQANVFVAAYHYWSIGKRSNRLFAEIGWSQRVTTGYKFTQTYGSPISKTSADVYNLISPGGPIIGAGFSFGSYR